MRALSLDAAFTLLHPAEPVADVYLRTALKHGVDRVEGLPDRFRAAFGRFAPLRLHDPGWVAFWRAVVEHATGATGATLELVFDELYDHYAQPESWRVEPGAHSLCERARNAGHRVVVSSNWDTRLRPLLNRLALPIDGAVISGEEGVEKPSRVFFERVVARTGCTPEAIVHVGDSKSADVEGARAAGLQAFHYGPGPDADIASLAELEARLYSTQ